MRLTTIGMRVAVATACTAGLWGSVAAYGQSASLGNSPSLDRQKELVQEFFQLVNECAEKNVALLDDRISSADVVAGGLVTYCVQSGAYQQVAAHQEKNLNPMYYADWRAQHIAAARPSVVVIVLKNRVKSTTVPATGARK